MKGLILIAAVLALLAFGGYVMRRLDRALDAVQDSGKHEDEQP